MSDEPTGLADALADRYRLLGEIGRGGMATVYRAHDLKHDRPVALKVLHPDLAASLGPERFKREILIAARLQHPHILSVFDSGEAAGRLWFTMPFVEGESVRDRLRRGGPLPVEDALRITREAAQALAHAHKQGVIHRDIKPENILLTEDGSTLVADFGIARAIGDRSFEQGLTQTGSTIGTPTYMAPEQATGETVLDERVDQYALAAVLYEMLTGQPPFSGPTAAALIAARFTSSVTPVRTQRADVPAGVDTAVQRALALKPFDRFPTITDFARAVAPNITTPPQFDTLARARAAAPTRRWSLATAGLLVLAVAGVAAMLWQRRGRDDASGPVRIAVLPLQNLGDSADAAFAEGMTDELRMKLVSLPGLQVIARASSVGFAGSSASPSEIAEALDVRYLLTGTLRYVRQPDGTSAVQVRPELMEVNGDGPATTRWQGAFSEPLSNASALQATIAEQVAAQLEVTLGTVQRTALAQPLTGNPAAYDAYLRAMGSWSQDVLTAARQRVADLERAVALDPEFAAAWAELARARAAVLNGGRRTSELVAGVREAAERARALARGGIADHEAWYWYYRLASLDNAKAMRELTALRGLAPNNPAYMARLARLLDAEGRADEAGPLYEAAARLDPLNVSVWANYSSSLLDRRQYAAARAPLERWISLEPGSQAALLDLVVLYAGMGDQEAAHRVIRDAYRRMAPDVVDTYLATYQDYGWLLPDSAQQRVLQAPVAAFDGDTGLQLIAQAQILHARGDLAGSRTTARRARPHLAANAVRDDLDPQWAYIEAFAAGLAGQAGDVERLIREGAARQRRRPMLPDDRAYYDELSARALTLAGQQDRALDLIESLLARPGRFGKGHLALDPNWAPLRALPRYQQLMVTASTQEAR